MDILKASDNLVKSLHASIDKCLREDDALPPDRDKIYDVREFPDWREWGDMLEAELDRRGIAYAPISW